MFIYSSSQLGEVESPGLIRVGSGATRDGEQSLDRRSRGARSPSRKAHRGSRESGDRMQCGQREGLCAELVSAHRPVETTPVANGGNHGSRSWGKPPHEGAASLLPHWLPFTALHRF